ncbi:unnamed protein product [Spirodela intermedia]|uniref:Myb-like domain-containing protein n=1 Tax=Spirodela intermedia TaxID=51605 RepID=A0A7I8IHX0_SPIIN|nr:unnamed protein product [Spirodela intermedia]CAA6656462.1 unnamed protein product [Spirodela intermedia]
MQQGGSQYGVPPPEAASFPGSDELPPPLAEVASPISSLPPSRTPGNFDELAAPAAAGGFPGDDDLAAAAGDDAERGGGGGGNRWPRQETLALLKIRSEMDAAFRDATLKAPLWEEVSRVQSEREEVQGEVRECPQILQTHQGRPSRPAGRQELPLLLPARSPHLPRSPQAAAPPLPAALPPPSAGKLHPAPLNSIPLPSSAAAALSFSDTSTSSDSDESERRNRGGGGGGRRKMMAFFEGLMRQVVERQEAMQQRFLETIEKRDQERTMREEAWRRQEMARLARDHDAAAHDRAVSAARDAAIISFLQKITGQPPPLRAAAPPPPPPPPPPEMAAPPAEGVVPSGTGDSAATSRWPKSEVQALINLRGELETKYQEVGPKGPLWEEISAAMRRLGYHRSAKRCKEKWENINKYFKKVKESNKRRPEDSKTCPYFHQLDALYRKKLLLTGGGAAAAAAATATTTTSPPQAEAESTTDNGGAAAQKPGDTVMEMPGRQEQQQQQQQEEAEKVNSEEMMSDEGEEEEEEQYKIQFQQSSRVNGTPNGGAAAVAAGPFMAMIQ